ERLNDAVTRVVELKIKRGLIGGSDEKSKVEKQNFATEIVGCKEHKIIEREIASKAVTVVKNEGNMLPMKLEDGKTIGVIDYYTIIEGAGAYSFGSPGIYNALEKIKMEQKYQKLKIKKTPIIFEGSQTGIKVQSTMEELKKNIDECDYVIFAPYQYDTGAIYAPMLFLPKEAQLIVNELVDYANETNKQYAYIDVKDPYDVAYLPQAKNMINAYANVGGDIVSGMEYREVANVEMAVRAAFGLIDTTGILPVDVKKANDNNVVYKAGEGIKLNKITDGYIYKTEVLEEDKGITPLNIALGMGILVVGALIVLISRKKEYIES
ncbi:MAG: hypothetical protein ACRC2K_10360, partial [Clostridium sp.]